MDKDIDFFQQQLLLIENTQSFLLSNSWSNSERDFFESLAEYLTITTQMNYVCISKLINNEKEAETVAIYFNGKFEENTRFIVDGTPCGKVVGNPVCIFPVGVCKLFPKDAPLQDIGAESYVGITLWGPKGIPIGIIAVIGQKPLTDTRNIELVLKQVSIRAASELEHMQLEAKLKENEKQLRLLYKSMNEGFVNHEIVYQNEEAIDYIITDINPAFEEITGITGSSIVGKKASEVYGTGDPPYLNIYSKVASNGSREYFETYFAPMKKHLSISVFSPETGKFATIFTDITERKKKEESLNRLNRLFTALGKSSQAMLHSSDEIFYLEQVCRIIVEDCGFTMVWIGFAEDDEAKKIHPVASAGFEEGYLESLNLTWADTERGQGPTGTAIRTGRVSKCSNIHTDPAFKPWREQAIKRGYASSVVFPLIAGDKAFGAINIYSREPDSFSDVDIKLLNELSNDLAHGITSIRLRTAHQKAEEALIQSYNNLEILVRERTTELHRTNDLLRNEINIRKRQEQILKIAEEKYRTVADFTYDWESWQGPDGKYIYISPSCLRITGYTIQEFMDDPTLLTRITHPDDLERVKNHFKNEKNEHTLIGSQDFRIITRDKEIKWIGHNCQSVFDAEGKWNGIRSGNRDITEQKKIDQVLINSEKQLRALTHRMDLIAEEERTRIAREVHDELGHILTALKYDIENLSVKPDLTIDEIRDELGPITTMVDALIDTVRKISSDLRPGILDHLGLFPAIEWQIKQFQLRTNTCCNTEINVPTINFDKEETTIIYRILQEILTNVARHSKANVVTISTDQLKNQFILKVSDNGIGFDFNRSHFAESLGLLGMKERAISIGGDLIIESSPGKGTTIIFMIERN